MVNIKLNKKKYKIDPNLITKNIFFEQILVKILHFYSQKSNITTIKKYVKNNLFLLSSSIFLFKST